MTKTARIEYHGRKRFRWTDNDKEYSCIGSDWHAIDVDTGKTIAKGWDSRERLHWYLIDCHWPRYDKVEYED